MKYKKAINSLVVFIAALTVIAASFGLFMTEGEGTSDFQSVYGESIMIYGKGLYQADSVSIAAQAMGQDLITILVIPLLLVSLHFAGKGSLKGRLMLAGLIGYLLYTYTSYSFLVMYNSLFLVYVMIMSSCFFAFVLILMSFDPDSIRISFKSNLPVKFIGGYLIFFSVLLTLMWLGLILPNLFHHTVPLELEHYTTLGIQAMDLGFVIPATIMSGILLLGRKPFGYLLSSVMIIKLITLSAAVIAMAIGMSLAGVKVGLVNFLFFPIFACISIYCLVLIMRNVADM